MKSRWFQHLPLTNHSNNGVTMATIKLAHIERLSQQISYRLESIDQLMLQVWTEHQLARKALRHLSEAYDLWVSERGADHEE